MATDSPSGKTRIRAPTRTRFGAAGASLLLLAVIAFLDSITPWEVSFALLYLIPVTIAAWYVGTMAGILLAVCSAMASAVITLAGYPSIAMNCWNAVIWFGVLLTYCLVLDLIKAHDRDFPIGRMLRLVALVALLFTTVLAVVSVGFRLGAPAARVAELPIKLGGGAATSQEAKSQDEFAALLTALSRDYSTAVAASRPILLGSRDPNASSCVSVIRSGELNGIMTPSQADYDGGPGTRMGILYFFDRQRCKSADDDFAWHQGRLKTSLENDKVNNVAAHRLVHALARQAKALDECVSAWTSWPDGAAVTACDSPAATSWLALCINSLNQSIAARDLAGTKRWAAELSAATFALEDLHRWLGFLVDNQLTALEFQNQCQSLFSTPDAKPYNLNMTISQYPAGLLSLNSLSNYYEVERQAEGLFGLPRDLTDADAIAGNIAAICVPPGVRRNFLAMEQVLGAENRKTWEQAACTPYEHSYLVNMLYRMTSAGAADSLRTVLHRFDQSNPHAPVRDLMSVMMYRGQCFAGLEWADRYQPALVQAAELIHGSDSDVFLAARDWTSRFYHTPCNYTMTLTLRDALAQQKLDCIRSTDMIAAIYRNAGHAGFGHVWWCGGTASHSVAALLPGEYDGPITVTADGLVDPPRSTVSRWPDAYFRGHTPWPAEMEHPDSPYAVELYVRGLDNYVWAEGYIVRGPNAGTLARAPVPYLPQREKKSVQTVFAGPYPLE